MKTSRPLSLVTGASSGIGFELAREFADHGHDLLIAAEDEDIHTAARRLGFHGTRVRAVQVDLADPEGVESLVREARAERRPLYAVALNAGIGRGGAFLGTELADQLRVIDLNVVSTVHLARRLLEDMAAAGEGRLLITSSVAAETPGPYHAVHNASEAFLRSFALGLRAELADTGVTVTSLMPGPTDTRFFVRAGLLDTRLGRSRKDDPALVARQAYEALVAGRPQVVAGSLHTRAQELATHALPARARAALHRHRAAPGGSRSHL
ncbi:SDR family NAD(P)-dependent oxidoreductase [Streptomyces sp. RerS4]|uniref:SDR family NAD(P)-dependent oxidoreductase n=1 Tax=Streptomyces sp. RerS4 TaxID=2942449 RepID=UPI00201C2FFF|nr:SDR family NAD(P)-dependent oxidoreductase [Streptomyces sp. RerS4]UQW99616.1 SDR family NAD(P)-dependent oxidoreductase [Streptomyces sp. RerS4]